MIKRDLKILYFFFSWFFLQMAFGQEEKKKTEEESIAIEKKTYTHEEFLKAVDEKVDQTLKRTTSRNIAKLSREILDKERELSSQENELKSKQEQLLLSERDLVKKIADFRNEQQKFIKCLDDRNARENQRIDRVVSIISGMRPLQASEVLSVQEEDISVKILARIEPVKASKIFNLMKKEISARIQRQYLNMKK